MLLAVPLCVVGAAVAHRNLEDDRMPTPRSVLSFVILPGVVVPASTGAIDLYLRAHTP